MDELKQIFDKWLEARTIGELRRDPSEIIVRKFGRSYQIKISDGTLKELAEIVRQIKEHGVKSANKKAVDMTNGTIWETKQESEDCYGYTE